jgi:hypothetical protein
VVNGVIEEPPTIAEYIEKLYKCEEVLYQPTVDFPDQQVISLEMLEIARRKLSNGKAVGIDLLSDTLLKNRVVFDSVKHKLKGIFTGWYN